MTESKSLRDELAMSAPWEHITRDDIMKAETKGILDLCFADELKLRYRYADIAMRVRDETMPKVERRHPEWARWALRMPDGLPFYFESEPTRLTFDEIQTGWYWSGRNEMVEGDTSFIPANWRESKVRLQ